MSDKITPEQLLEAQLAEVAAIVKQLRKYRCNTFPDPQCDLDELCQCAGDERAAAALESLAAQLAEQKEAQERGTAALREAFGPELWSLGHPAYVITHLREERSKVERLWKEATMQLTERDAEIAALKGHAVEPRIGLNSDGSLDEVVGSPGHIEQLDSGHWFVEIGEYAIWLHAKGKIVAHYEHRAAYPKE